MLRGLYRHYKGGLYLVRSIAKHTETQESLVIYQSIETNIMWARPLTMFHEKVTYNDKIIDRFTYIDSDTKKYISIDSDNVLN